MFLEVFVFVPQIYENKGNQQRKNVKNAEYSVKMTNFAARLLKQTLL
jgi:hypothetical protein